jgi:hypothetical protein
LSVGTLKSSSAPKTTRTTSPSGGYPVSVARMHSVAYGIGSPADFAKAGWVTGNRPKATGETQARGKPC